MSARNWQRRAQQRRAYRHRDAEPQPGSILPRISIAGWRTEYPDDFPVTTIPGTISSLVRTP